MMHKFAGSTKKYTREGIDCNCGEKYRQEKDCSLTQERYVVVRCHIYMYKAAINFNRCHKILPSHLLLLFDLLYLNVHVR